MFKIRPLSRSISYLHIGKRVVGLKRDPQTFMVSPSGIKYTDFKNDTKFTDQVRKTLQFDKYQLHLTDKIILQCFTHKSFAHGFVPYNEKLSLLGVQYLKLLSSIKSITNAKGISPINTYNFDKLGSIEAKNELNDSVIYNWLQNMKLTELIFWKKKSDVGNSRFNGEPKIMSTVLHSLIGALVLTNGEPKTCKYVNDFLLNKESRSPLLP